MRKLIALAAVLTLAFAGAASAQDVTVQENWTGTPRDDRHIGTPGRDLLLPGNGDDYVDARGGNDTIYDGFGNDTAIGGTGVDRVHGGPGDDTIYTGTRADRKDGAKDTFSCGRGQDVVFAEDKDIQASGGCERIVGGNGGGNGGGNDNGGDDD